MAGRLPEGTRTRPKTPFTGSPLLAHLRQSQPGWIDQVEWNPQMESYINRSELATLRNETNAEQACVNIRPVCLNFWLQSARKVRYNLRAEVRNA